MLAYITVKQNLSSASQPQLHLTCNSVARESLKRLDSTTVQQQPNIFFAFLHSYYKNVTFAFLSRVAEPLVD